MGVAGCGKSTIGVGLEQVFNAQVSQCTHSTEAEPVPIPIGQQSDNNNGTTASHTQRITFIDGDHYHTVESKEKMASGIPLNDADRLPWLQTLHGLVEQNCQKQQRLVLACSALKASYRALLTGARHTLPGVPSDGEQTTATTPSTADHPVLFLLLHGDTAVLQSRLEHRKGHFMPTQLLEVRIA